MILLKAPECLADRPGCQADKKSPVVPEIF
jgi:hypothetical protein